MDEMEPVGLCLACLRVRADVDAGWLALESASKKRTTYFCSDEFAFPARESVTSSTRCPSCGNSSEVIAVDEEMADRVTRFVTGRGRSLGSTE